MALTRVAGCGRWGPLLVLQYVIEGRALQARLHEAVDESTNQIGRYCEGKRGGWRRHGVGPRPVGQWLQNGANCQSTAIPRQSRICFHFGTQSSVTQEHLPSPTDGLISPKRLF